MEQPQGSISKQNWTIIIIFMIANFLCIVSETVMNVALPNIMNDFGVTTSTAQWLTTGYMLVIGVSIPVSAYLMERFTLRQLFISAMTFYTIGSLIAFLSPTFAILLSGRLIQAVGTGIIMPLIMNIILIVTPINKRGSIIGFYTLVILFAPAIGPVISGIAINISSWRLIFIIIMILGVITLITGILKLINITEQKETQIDVFSIILSTLGFGGIVFGFSTAGEGSGWGNPLVWVGLAVGVIALTWFVRRQTKLKAPILKMAPFKSSVFSRSMILMLLIMTLQFSMMLIIPLYFQIARGLSPLESGFIMLPGSVVLALSSFVAGNLFDKIGFKPIVLSGLGVMLFILFFFTRLSEDTTLLSGMILYAVFCLGLGFALPPVQTLSLNQLDKDLYTHGSAIANTTNQVSGAIGPALYTSIMTMASNSFVAQSNITDKKALEVASMTHGVHVSYTVAIVVACIAFIVAFTLKKKHQTANEVT